jgi:hypothetical protein
MEAAGTFARVRRTVDVRKRARGLLRTNFGFAVAVEGRQKAAAPLGEAHGHVVEAAAVEDGSCEELPSRMPAKRLRRSSITATIDSTGVVSVESDCVAAGTDGDKGVAVTDTSFSASNSAAVLGGTPSSDGPVVHTTSARCGITMEDTHCWISTECCRQPVDALVYYRLCIEAPVPSCPFCRHSLPSYTTERALAQASPAARQLLQRLPGSYADLLFNRLVHLYASHGDKLIPACHRLAAVIKLSESQLAHLPSLTPAQYYEFCTSCAVYMFNNWMEVLPGNASEAVLVGRLLPWLQKTLAGDSVLVHSCIMAAVRRAIVARFRESCDAMLLPMFLKPLTMAVYSRFHDTCSL